MSGEIKNYSLAKTQKRKMVSHEGAQRTLIIIPDNTHTQLKIQMSIFAAGYINKQ